VNKYAKDRTVPVIAVDVDGTLTKEICWTEDDCLKATPRQTVIDRVNELSATSFIIIHTARRNKLYNATIKWLDAHGVCYHAIRMEKMPADIYVDDKSILPEKL
jgi:uncharacterized HAD superfamily protein